MIDRLTLKNFTAFRDLDIKFSPKINIIIGENGTGKTHLLKAAYALCDCIDLDPLEKRALPKKVPTKDTLARMLGDSLIDIFNPEVRRLGRLVNRTSDEDAGIFFCSNGGHSLDCGFGARAATNVKIIGNEHFQRYSYVPVYIPAKEVLSFYRGIRNPDADELTLSKLFDSTYINLCAQLSRLPENPVGVMLAGDPRLGAVYPKISNAIGGQYSIQDDSIYFKAGRFDEVRDREQHKLGDRVNTVFTLMGRDFIDPLATSMTAEGFRKIGALQMLLLNRSIHPGGSGPLIWDEPEANMNPKLMKTVVETLLELSRNGQQIILATHDYVVLKWFDLLMDIGKEDHVRYHSLYRGDDGAVQLHSTNDYDEIYPNPIDEAFGYLVDREIANDMGSLGK